MLSSEITLARLSMFLSFSGIVLSAIIWEARDIVEIGVLSSCVILFMKSLLISEIFFWRKITIKVPVDKINRRRVKSNDIKPRLPIFSNLYCCSCRQYNTIWFWLGTGSLGKSWIINLFVPGLSVNPGVFQILP